MWEGGIIEEEKKLYSPIFYTASPYYTKLGLICSHSKVCIEFQQSSRALLSCSKMKRYCIADGVVTNSY
ncbi:hypothetical protein GOP47_0010275 [Adiantum capillus-veneris]|uniref:Uncharacterized protein n=1 Tax=Adiantum capillus-veneris TaxID=13818 RepID=A0A9D4UUF2_ADICA|nr:hypothetical protein GOP47_0010275 [Adiantum capillus-veneris]